MASTSITQSTGIFPLRQFPLHQFPLSQFPFCQFPFGQFPTSSIPTSSIPTSSIPILSIPIWSISHLVNFPFGQCWQSENWQSGNWQSGNWRSGKLTKWNWQSGKINNCYQGRIEPQKAARGHATYIDGKILNIVFKFLSVFTCATTQAQLQTARMADIPSQRLSSTKT